MDKQELDRKITTITKSLLSYCRVRTSNPFDAEDLAQDIILALYKSADNLRNEEAFYGFMWAVAGNVYKNWCKNKAKSQECTYIDERLSEELSYVDHVSDAENTELYLLRRELTLLTEKNRKAVILYYIEHKSCAEISCSLSISESMVKYLLFKSRQILKEGMNMERNYGIQSYNPKELSLMFWGNSANRYYHLCDNKISQNILFACYNDKLTAEQISLEIGVALPYMEDKLKELFENDLLKKDGNRYYTNLVIFTAEFTKEVRTKTAKLQKHIADILARAITEHESEVRALNFSGSDMCNQTFAWQMTSFILYRAIIEILQSKIHVTYPKDKYGTECFIWGSEKCNENLWLSQFGFGVSNMTNDAGAFKKAGSRYVLSKTI